MKLWLTGVLLLGTAWVRPGWAQDSRLAARLDPATARSVSSLADSARAENLPSEPLIQRALEGVTKRASGDRIVGATRALLDRLRTSRRTLGEGASPEELVAAASALQAGVSASGLADIQGARGDESLVVPLVVLADLIGRGVQVETASTTILFMTRAGIADERFLDFRSRVEKDILSGISPATATTIRAGGAVSGGGRARSPAGPRTRP